MTVYVIFSYSDRSVRQRVCVWGCECRGKLGYGGVYEGATNPYLSKMAFTDMRKINPSKEGVTEMENEAQIFFSLTYN